MSWLAYSRFPSTEPRTAAGTKGKMVNSIRPVADAFEPQNQRPYPVDYGADRERARPVNEQPAPMSRGYYQQIAMQPYPSSGLGAGFIAVDSPSYSETDQELAAAQPDYAAAPQSVTYAQPVQIVSFSNGGRSFGNRRRSLRSGELVSVIPRLPDRQVVPRLPDRQVVPRLPDTAEPRLSGRVVTPRQNPNASSCGPTQGFGPRWHR
jgi:hypothetical protein